MLWTTFLSHGWPAYKLNQIIVQIALLQGKSIYFSPIHGKYATNLVTHSLACTSKAGRAFFFGVQLQRIRKFCYWCYWQLAMCYHGPLALWRVRNKSCRLITNMNTLKYRWQTKTILSLFDASTDGIHRGLKASRFFNCLWTKSIDYRKLPSTRDTMSP